MNDDWKLAQIDPNKMDQIHQLEKDLGIVLVAWMKKPS